MFVGLRELRKNLEDFARDFDPALITAAQANALLADAAAIEKMAATVKAKSAARVADTDMWRRAGDASPADFLARTTGTNVGAAIETIRTAHWLEHLPDVDAAARRGELSPQQVSAVSGAAVADPGAEGRLLDAAKKLPLKELQAECGRTRAAVEDPEARRKRIHDRRFVRESTDAEGAWHLHACDNPEVGAEIMAALNARRDRLFAQARAEGRRESSEAYAMDALAELARAGNAGRDYRPSLWVKAIIRADFDALLRGYPVDGEVVEIAGMPVAVSAVEDVIASGSAFLAGLVTNCEQVVGVAHFGRAPNVKQQTALEWLYPTCAAEGCARGARLQRDHRVDWSKTHVTVLDLLDLLCEFHHGLKTTAGWGLVEGRGKRPFVPPDDPRHPQHAPPSAA
jgi:hypothetical protein